MKKIPLVAWLLIILAVGQGIALAYAGVAIDDHAPTDPLFWLSMARGVVGVGVSGAVSWAAYNLPRVQARLPRRIGWVAWGLTITASIVVLSICTFGKPEGGFRVAASVAFAIMAESAATALAASSGRLFAEKPAESEPKRGRAKAKPAAVFRCPVKDCGVTKPTQNALNAHMGKHKVIGYDLKLTPVMSGEKDGEK